MKRKTLMLLVVSTCLIISALCIGGAASTNAPNTDAIEDTVMETERATEPPKPSTNPSVIETTVPVAAEPVETEPVETEPVETTPEVTEPPIVTPPVVKPPVVEPQVTEPPTTEPPTTEPEVDDSQTESSESDSNLISLGTFKLTAYCSCQKCCGQFAFNRPVDEYGNEIVYGSTGIRLVAGISVAVDPSVIPYGTQVVINGHTYTAHDTGGSIKGSRIDVYFDNHQDAWNFGTQYAEVFVYR